jgi:hypothetical protein
MKTKLVLLSFVTSSFLFGETTKICHDSFMAKNYEKAIAECSSLLKDKKYQKDFETNYNIAFSYTRKGDFKTSLEKSKELEKLSKNYYHLFLTYNLLAVDYANLLTDKNKELHYSLKALEMAKKLNQPDMICNSLTVISNYYVNNQEIEKGESYLLEAYEYINEENLYIETKITILNNLSIVEQELKKEDESRKYALEALKLANSKENTNIRSKILINLTYANQNMDLVIADKLKIEDKILDKTYIDFIEENLNLAKEIKNIELELYSERTKATYYFVVGNLEEAKNIFTSILKRSKESGNNIQYDIALSYLKLMETYPGKSLKEIANITK